MSIITNYDRDFGMSIQFSKNWDYTISKNNCYRNIYNIVTEWGLDHDIQVGYGYWGNPSISMIRHCFLVQDGKVIDPTLGDINREGCCYHIFKLFSQGDYYDTFYNFLEQDPDGEIYDSLIGMIPEEAEYCKYAIENKVHIDKYSYMTYLERYDSEQKIIVADSKSLV